MFTSNPWAVYGGALTGAMFIYYIFVGWKYFRTEITNLSRRRSNKNRFGPGILIKESRKTTEPSPQSEQTSQDEDHPVRRNQDIQIEDLCEHLATEIQEAHIKQYSKQDLLLMIQMILKDYSMLEGTQFQLAVNSRIEAECAKYGSIHLSKGEITDVWRKVV